MATAPPTKGLEVDSDGNYVLPRGHRAPGWTVDALLEAGKVEEAGAELESLISAGVNSGPSIPMDEAFWKRLRDRGSGEAIRTAMKRWRLPSESSPLAADDLETLIDYLTESSGAQVANRWLDSYDHTVELLCSTPLMGLHCRFQQPQNRHIRRFPVSGTFKTWLIFYTPSKTSVRIERVLHSARDWRRLFV